MHAMHLFAALSSSTITAHVLLVALMCLQTVHAIPFGRAAAGSVSDSELCRTLRPKHLFYNRVPKAASTSLKTLAADRAQSLGYFYVSSTNYKERQFLEEAKERANVQRITTLFDRHDQVLYDQHIRYLNFTRHGETQPAYINMVREPISRAVSTYYFARTGDHSQREEIRMKLGEAADWSINACVQRADECEFVKHPGTFNLMTSFFCGNDAVCHQSPESRLQNAKLHLERDFALVGITELFTETVRVLEHILPTFFEGSLTLIEARNGHRRNVNTKAGESPTPETRAYLRQLARYDVELYEFALQLFKRRYTACFGEHDWPF